MLKKKLNKEKLQSLYYRFLDFLKYNRQFLAYVLLSLISCSTLRIQTVGNLIDIRPMIFDLSIILLLGSLAYFFKPKKQYIYFMTIIIIITVLNMINSLYYAFYSSFASFSLLESVSQAAEVTDAVFEKIRITNFIYLLLPIAFIFFHKSLIKKDYFTKVQQVEKSKKLLMETAIVGGIFLFSSISLLTKSEISQLAKQWNREFSVQRFGVLVYQINDIKQSIDNKISSTFGAEEAYRNFLEYYQKNERKESKNKYTNVYKDYDVIVIHMESIMSFLIDFKINGKEVTPNLNKLVKESMYFDNFYPTVSVGTSSDTEFTFNTSLMPVQSGTVFVSYYNRNYSSLEKLLEQKKYYTFSMHGNKASMWNRDKMHKSLGYMDFYSKEYYTIDEEIGLGLSDSSFFKQSETIIEEIKKMVNKSDEYKHFMGTLITLTNHTPFNDKKIIEDSESFDVTYHTGKKDENGDEIVYDYLDGTTIGNYIKSVHYADSCLGELIKYVKNNKTFDKTLFVFYGDHAAQLRKSEFNRIVNFDFKSGEIKDEENPEYVNYDYYANEMFKKTPLILWSKDKKVSGKVSYPMGMIDALPTIGNMLGIRNKYALGHDIFEIKNNNVVVFPNGNFLTDKLYYYNTQNESKIFKEETIDDNYIDERKKYAEDILNVSNDIIVYNLIEKASGEQ